MRLIEFLTASVSPPGARQRPGRLRGMAALAVVLAVLGFGSVTGTGGLTLNPLVKAATGDLSVAFLRSVFGGDDVSLRNWPARHDGIVARFVALGS